MEPNDILIKLTNTIKQLNQLTTTSLSLPQERSAEFEEKESVLISIIVGCFDEILSDELNIKMEKNLKMKESKNHYWTFISKHFNTPVMRFCIIFDKNEQNNTSPEEILSQKGKNWIYFSILENSFSDSINEIYKQEWDVLYYEKNSIIRKYKTEIKNILKELKGIQLKSIKSKDFEKYQDYVNKNPNISFNEENELSQSPISNKKHESSSLLLISDFSMIPLETVIEPDDLTINDLINMPIPDIVEEKEFTFTKFADFGPCIVNDFYTFVVDIENDNNNKEKNDIIINKENFHNNISFANLNSFDDNDNDNDKNSENDQDSSKLNEDDLKLKPGLVLNPKISNHLPTDNLYEINEKTLTKEYNKNDKLTYNKKKRPISNSLLLYLNKFYQKAPYHKFFKHNLYNRPISIKEQNFQCYICRKKFLILFDIPIEDVFWCSYYMRFVCKNCIDDEYFIIPYFILKKWCFEKFSVSKKAKNILIE